MPVTLIFGAQDAFLTPESRTTSPDSSARQVHLLDDASHWPQWTSPTRLRLIRQALN
jgi:pimeloyl-ACP methyl ester carboxylesterase